MIDLRFTAENFQNDALATFAREIPNHELHSLKDLADLHHANPHHAFAEVS